MKKLTVFSVTALASVMMAGVPALTSQAAVYTYSVNGQNMMQGNFTQNSSCRTFGGGIFGALGNGQNCEKVSCVLPDCSGGWDCDQNLLPGMDIVQPSLPGGTVIQPDNSVNRPENRPEDRPENRPEDRPENKPEDKPESKPEAGSYAQEVLNLVNAERAKAGVGALTLDRNAQVAADTRAEEIQRSFSHTRPDGRNFSTALSEAGVNYSGSGENIAYGQNSPEEVMRVWMNSEGHRANILNSRFTSIGIGHAENGSGVDYWTQLFFN